MEPYLVTVVAIDDDAGSLSLVKAALKQHPVEVLTATDRRKRAGMLSGA